MVSVNFQTNEKLYVTGGAKKVQTAHLPLKNSPDDNKKETVNKFENQQDAKGSCWFFVPEFISRIQKIQKIF